MIVYSRRMMDSGWTGEWEASYQEVSAKQNPQLGFLSSRKVPSDLPRRARTQQPFMYNYCQYLPSSKCNAISFIEDINRITVIWATAVKFIGTLWCIWIWMYNCAVKVEQEKENQFVILESFAKINQTMKYSKHKQSLCILSRFNLFSESLKR